MIGRKAVDPVTGDLSPVIGVRINPENGIVIPVTLSSGGLKKRKPPLGAVSVWYSSPRCEMWSCKGYNNLNACRCMLFASTEYLYIIVASCCSVWWIKEKQTTSLGCNQWPPPSVKRKKWQKISHFRGPPPPNAFCPPRPCTPQEKNSGVATLAIIGDIILHLCVK